MAKCANDKKNQLKIRGVVEQSIFKLFLSEKESGGMIFCKYDRPQLSYIAKVAVKGVMKSEGLDIVLKRKRR
jgi:hypothetical protein